MRHDSQIKKTLPKTAAKTLDFLWEFLLPSRYPNNVSLLNCMARSFKLCPTVYARVSTLDRDPEMQLRDLKAYARHRVLPITKASRHAERGDDGGACRRRDE